MYFTNNHESPTMYLRTSPAIQFTTINQGGSLTKNLNCTSKNIFMRSLHHIQTLLQSFPSFSYQSLQTRNTHGRKLQLHRSKAHSFVLEHLSGRTLLHSKHCRLLFCLNYEIGFKIQNSVANNKQQTLTKETLTIATEKKSYNAS